MGLCYSVAVIPLVRSNVKFSASAAHAIINYSGPRALRPASTNPSVCLSAHSDFHTVWL